ncbi:MAG: DNA-binding protein Alba [Candidatus Aenigmarchaeota archaeon]|nr:DNA-binding protein Alba [Candidatus Aenigmarchaeota archaeon]
MTSDNTIYIGKKPTMSYVLAAITQFSGDATQVTIRARGRNISQAVDVAQVLSHRFIKDLKHSVQIGTEELKDKDDRPMRVSTIEITLTK